MQITAPNRNQRAIQVMQKMIEELVAVMTAVSAQLLYISILVSKSINLFNKMIY
jgi:hypothetical protein